ncbi:hypothetical protein Vretimale_2137 [Volvox reticuliferus]|uniref:Uncharacterized protein n=1 Tax=Volvox reticuliferus TaxID=1737510 RepID=A0A8J4C4A6_9CHLO|nr:hypothetical protein Vretifemale_4422 [Volvox reticuliferus]GIL96301.1 hypothetical protein Vretimale_2137 [Volvox reticuliferus]
MRECGESLCRGVNGFMFILRLCNDGPPTERGGSIVVESITPGGHASAAGIVAGDVLLATSARAQVDTGNGALRGQLVLLSTAGEKFSTVAAAIRSNTCSQCNVHLVLERPEGSVKPIS